MKRRYIYTILIVATIAVSWSSILIRLANADPISTAFYRMLFAVIILLPIFGKGLFKALKKLPNRNIVWLFISGILLGLHFATWISSLKYTTISNSVIIVSTQPFFVAIAETLIVKLKIGRLSIFGMVLAFIGMIIIFGFDYGSGGYNLYGNFLAFLGAIFAGGYLFLGKKIRQHLDNRHYILPVYLIASLTLLICVIITKSPLVGFSGNTWLLFILLGLIPTVFGHSLYNYLLKYMRAHQVGLAMLGEPIGASIFAVVLFAEYPPLATYIGGGFVLIGIALALFRTKSDDKMIETS